MVNLALACSCLSAMLNLVCYVWLYYKLLRPGRGAEYCDQFVCLCVCVCACVSVHEREHIAGTAGPIFTKFFVQIPCGRSSELLWRLCDTLCTSGFMNDVTLAVMSGIYGDAWKAEPLPTSTSVVAIRGRSLMSMNALLVVCACSIVLCCSAWQIVM